MDNELEKENSLNQDDELESLINSSADEEASASSDDSTSVETLEEKVKKLESINKQLYARLQKMKEAKSKVVENKDDSFWRQKIEFLISHKDFDNEHLDYLEAVAKGKGISLEEAYKLPIVQKAIESSLKEKKLAEALEGGKAKGETIKSLAEEAREAAKDPEKHKEFWKKMQSRPKGFQGE